MAFNLCLVSLRSLALPQQSNSMPQQFALGLNPAIASAQLHQDGLVAPVLPFAVPDLPVAVLDLPVPLFVIHRGIVGTGQFLGGGQILQVDLKHGATSIVLDILIL
jgi:hypothetical protein